MSRLDPITFQVLWARLVSIADEMAMTLVSTAFSPAVHDGHDFACAIYDGKARLLALATHGSPALAGAMQNALQSFLKTVPPSDLVPGDILICNDPWLGAGHTPDVFVATPIFSDGTIVGYAVNAAHHIDVGGRSHSVESREVFEEGLIFPPIKLMSAGRQNETLFRMIERNVRLPDKVVGDLRAQIAANHVGGRRVLGLLADRLFDDLVELGDQILDHTEVSMRRAIEQVPDGEYRHELTLEEADPNRTPIKICTTVKVHGDSLVVDFTGSSMQVQRPLNSVLNFTLARSLLALLGALHPHLPSNAGAIRPITVTAPEGSILNASFPAPVMLRTSLADYCIEGVFGALAQVIPNEVIAPSGTYPLYKVVYRGRDDKDKPFVYIFWGNGGQGAAHDRDGVSSVAFPSNTANTPAEIFENDTPLIVERKEYLADSAGPGRFRGGVGQQIRVKNISTRPVTVAAIGGRYLEGPSGVAGGRPGQVGRIQLDGCDPLTQIQQVELLPDQAMTMDFAGGGGYGNPLERDPARVIADVQTGFVTHERAASDYGVVVTPDLTVDIDATAALRRTGRQPLSAVAGPRQPGSGRADRPASDHVRNGIARGQAPR